MQMPQAVEPGNARQDIEWAKSAERGMFFALLLASALGWGLYALLTAKSFYPLLVIRALIVGSCLVVVTAFVVSILAEGILYLASARYRQVRGYRREPVKSARTAIWKALAAWLVMLLVSVANGAIRDFTYGKHINELAAHQLSTVGSVLLLAIVIRGYTWINPPVSARQAFSIGLLWMSLTIAFEFLFFHFAGGRSWPELLGNYNLLKGRVWPVVLVWIAIAPYVFFRADPAR
jgi:hypothetical protein